MIVISLEQVAYTLGASLPEDRTSLRPKDLAFSNGLKCFQTQLQNQLVSTAASETEVSNLGRPNCDSSALWGPDVNASFIWVIETWDFGRSDTPPYMPFR